MKIADWLVSKYEDYLVAKYSRKFGITGPEYKDGTEGRISRDLASAAYRRAEEKKTGGKNYKEVYAPAFKTYAPFPDYPFDSLGLPFGDGDASQRRRNMWVMLGKEYANLVEVLENPGLHKAVKEILTDVGVHRKPSRRPSTHKRSRRARKSR